MPYATHTTVDAPLAMYDAIHAHVLETTGGTVEGLLLHLCRATATGFEVFEVWESREHCDTFSREVLGAAFAAAAASTGADAGAARGAPAPHVEEFTPRGLVVPRAGVAV